MWKTSFVLKYVCIDGKIMLQFSIIKVELNNANMFNEREREIEKFLNLLSLSRTTSRNGHVYICVFMIIIQLHYVAENMMAF